MPGPPDQLFKGPAVGARAPCQTALTAAYRAEHRMLPGRLRQSELPYHLTSKGFGVCTRSTVELEGVAGLTHSSWAHKAATTNIAQRAMADAASVWTGRLNRSDFIWCQQQHEIAH